MSKSLTIPTPSVSVVIPTLNRCYFLKAALNSVLAQSIPIDEVIVVDNGSTDGTVNMVRKSFPTVRLISANKRGVSSARNKGIKISTGEWVALLDSDDQWLPTKLEKQFETYFREETESKLIHTNEIWLKNNNQIAQLKKHKKMGGNVFNRCLALCCISPSSAVIRRDLFKDLGYFDENMPVCEDYDMWLRLCVNNRVIFLDEELVIKHGGHDDQLSTKYWGMDRFRIYALEKLLKYSCLSSTQKAAVSNMIIAKCEILIKGGIKRKNFELVGFYSRKQMYFQNTAVEKISICEEPKIYE